MIRQVESQIDFPLLPGTTFHLGPLALQGPLGQNTRSVQGEASGALGPQGVLLTG